MSDVDDALDEYVKWSEQLGPAEEVVRQAEAERLRRRQALDVARASEARVRVAFLATVRAGDRPGALREWLPHARAKSAAREAHYRSEEALLYARAQVERILALQESALTNLLRVLDAPAT